MLKNPVKMKCVTYLENYMLRYNFYEIMFRLCIWKWDFVGVIKWKGGPSTKFWNQKIFIESERSSSDYSDIDNQQIAIYLKIEEFNFT